MRTYLSMQVEASSVRLGPAQPTRHRSGLPELEPDVRVGPPVDYRRAS